MDYELEMLSCPICMRRLLHRSDQPTPSCLATPACRTYRPRYVDQAYIERVDAHTRTIEAMMPGYHDRLSNPNHHGRK